MSSYKDPSFQDRVGRALEAKRKALDALRSKAPVDEKVVAERQAVRARREAAEAEKREAKKAAESAAKEARALKAAEKAASIPAPPTEADRKAARDARYAARKSRK
ncbi:hypothetical protein IC614_00590 [Allosphingosinicella flava]|uniref:Uncharacterized protein n=1 Tax=Allosphingosinicella flava TaxID=2771430 RepID=A0A7T2GJY4_9SPHN|nr:DUF6481 family protein [Sphingosinicella flava]QPQ55157.1 hypothetical protein IC614_00590 [Sphingosinicella flava]